MEATIKDFWQLLTDPSVLSKLARAAWTLCCCQVGRSFPNPSSIQPTITQNNKLPNFAEKCTQLIIDRKARVAHPLILFVEQKFFQVSEISSNVKMG